MLGSKQPQILDFNLNSIPLPNTSITGAKTADEILFDLGKLHFYRTAIAFVSSISELLSEIPKKVPVHNQREWVSTSIPLNIAEGNGKFTSADRFRFFDTAPGSALVSAAALEVLVAKGLVVESKITLVEIV